MGHLIALAVVLVCGLPSVALLRGRASSPVEAEDVDVESDRDGSTSSFFIYFISAPKLLPSTNSYFSLNGGSLMFPSPDKGVDGSLMLPSPDKGVDGDGFDSDSNELEDCGDTFDSLDQQDGQELSSLLSLATLLSRLFASPLPQESRPALLQAPRIAAQELLNVPNSKANP
jgi:hypothetical protein